MSDYRGRFLWYELMTTDVAAAKAFYGEVTGWGTSEWEGGEMPYSMFMTGETPQAGLIILPEKAKALGAPPNWMAYIGTPDVDATMAKAIELGGKAATDPIEIPNIGRFVVLSDPQGAYFSAYTPSEPPSTPLARAEVGGFSWNELMTTDWEGAWTFYEALFGWKKTDSMDMGPEMGGIYQMWGMGDLTLGGMFNKPASVSAPPHWLLYIRVPDVDEAAERVKSNGGQVLNGPMEVPGGDRIVQCMDPQGAAFAMHHCKS
ncbi:VOC family protein [Haliangium sp.]|uniref:VOC family protein n=1 Tax=Haliangium sp. TaxID=2663208 RepID=UPI003D0BD33E